MFAKPYANISCLYFLGKKKCKYLFTCAEACLLDMYVKLPVCFLGYGWYEMLWDECLL